MIELEIDDHKVSIEAGASIIEAADQIGIYIPRFCYHKKLSIAANCRMCLVEVEGSHKPLPACATPVTDKMKVYTASKLVLDAQRSVMEFLLINHPLDCPICDQGGMCELQDTAMGYGECTTEFSEPKVPTYSQNIGPLIDTEMTRCIKCTRCIRFGEEIAGVREIGMINRGENSEISNFLQHMMGSELSGNIIDLCPVGALNAKPSRYVARGFEMQEHPSVAPHDCVGSNVSLHCLRHDNNEAKEIVSVVPRQNEALNESWLSDRDRFSYQALQSDNRILHPMIKQKGKWVKVDWQRALVEIADKFRAIISNHGGEGIAALASPSSTTEECYLLQKLLRGLGSNNIDYRTRQQSFDDSSFDVSNIKMESSIQSIEDMDAILLVGSNIRSEQPIISHRMNQAVSSAACAMRVDVRQHSTLFNITHDIVQLDLVSALAAIAKSLMGKDAISALKDIEVTPAAVAIAEQLKSAVKGGIFVGAIALMDSQAVLINKLVRLIAEHSECSINILSVGANSLGAYLAGALPHSGPVGTTIKSPGCNACQILDDHPAKAYILLDTDVGLDSSYSSKACDALKQASMVVSLSSFMSDTIKENAHFILPIAPFGENEGTFFNAEGCMQTFSAASAPRGESKPAWKVLRALAGFMMLDSFDYKTSHQALNEVCDLLGNTLNDQASAKDLSIDKIKPLICNELSRVAHWPIYSGDSLARNAAALQQVAIDNDICIYINHATAKRLLLVDGNLTTAKQGSSLIKLPLRIDNALADDAVIIPSGCEATAGFGMLSAPITLTQEAVC